jgi:peptidoglycan/LPS O-acetylase OafA/YrhL
LMSIALTALCWGAYGPVLHRGQAKMKGSRMRPFLCVGLSYFLVAVIVPLGILFSSSEPMNWTVSGLFWSMSAGSAGAIGALGIILAFNFGGKPIFVMPLVFGCAPVVNTFTTMVVEKTFSQIQTPFWGSLAMVVAGAVTVLIFSPKPGSPKPGKDDDD